MINVEVKVEIGYVILKVRLALFLYPLTFSQQFLLLHHSFAVSTYFLCFLLMS